MVSANVGSRPEAGHITRGASTRIAIDPETFNSDHITRLTHELADHPLLALDRVRELALRRPAGRVRWHRADIPVSTNFANAAREHANGRTLDDTLDAIEHAGSWVFLQHIEEDPIYREFVFAVLSGVSPVLKRIDPGMHNLHGWIFVSSPNAITPYHMDHEANFLLQIRGRKTINVWDPKDRSILDERQLETFHGAWSLNDTKWKDEFQPKAHVIDATPGTGVFMPFTAPHTVQNGNAVSITLSLTFLTTRSMREQELFAANHKLRKMGLAPRPVGTSRLVDEAKVQAFHAWTGARKLAQKAAKILGRAGAGSSESSPY